ncbi:hypothetical protein [Aromatoleum buckelii]|uniref:Uncharacterized protein n=1 Tax=Aromatoleum buckelii TaxID=200254 RepID=A0ABX1N2U1_9RHOO|nr:hypothetical protein [Aromatoleum buckelii]MCK0510746.1 hypothetical protein [Aromatoleum buckelii]
MSHTRSSISITGWQSVIALFAVFCTPLSAAGGALDPSETLSALRENHAIVLGRARVTGHLNETARSHKLNVTGPRSRDFSIKMVWAPERKTALFAGANHGVPHRLNDVWEFDLAQMEWRLLYEPDNSRSYLGLGSDASDVVFRDGILVTKRGGPAVVGHTWSGLTYDPERKRMLFMSTWVTKQDDVVKMLGGDPGARFRGPPLWAFDPHARKWDFVETARPWPKAPFGAMLEYVPELHGAIWHMNNWEMRATWLYRSEPGAWTNLNANSGGKDIASQAPGRELVGYYDPVRKIVVAQWKRNTFHFDPKTRTWSRVLSATGSEAPRGHDARTAFYHDAASGHGLLVDLAEKKVWAYDPDATKWTALKPEGDPMPSGKRMLAYADAARNVLVVIDDTTIWAYRYCMSRSE